LPTIIGPVDGGPSEESEWTGTTERNRGKEWFTIQQEPGLKRFLVLSILFAVPLDSALLLIGQFESEQALRNYTDVATFIPLTVATIILFIVVRKTTEKSLKNTTLFLAIGFLLQVAFSLVWIYYWHIVNREGLPDVSIGDAFYLGSYFFWTAATIPYFNRYRTLMSRRSLGVLAIYSIGAAIILLMTLRYWYDAALLYDYSWFTTAVWLAYPVAATVSVFFMIALALLYGFERYGKGLLKNYWLYFLSPIMIIALADNLNGYYFVLSGNSIPGRLDDVLYLAGYAVAIAAGLTIVMSKLDTASVIPSVEEHVLRDGSVRITKGRGTIVEDPKSNLSFELFARLIAPEESDTVRDGYILSRRAPATIREEFSFKNVRITWIATGAGQDVMDPTKPGMIAHMIMEFLSKTKNGVVLLDGIESVMVHNDFNRTARMLEQINDFVMQYRGYLIVPIDPKAFDSRERALLMRNFETVAVRTVDV